MKLLKSDSKNTLGEVKTFGVFVRKVSGKENTFTKYYDKRNSMW